MTDGLLQRLETYYDGVPRRFARIEECGPFTLFLGEPGGWSYYARPRLGGEGAFSPDDVTAAAERLGELRIPALVVAGGRDLPYTGVVASRLVDGIRGATALHLPQAGHMANLEEPAVVNAALAALASRT